MTNKLKVVAVATRPTKRDGVVVVAAPRPAKEEEE